MVTAALRLAETQLEQRERPVGARWTRPLQRLRSLGGRMSRAGGTQQWGVLPWGDPAGLGGGSRIAMGRGNVQGTAAAGTPSRK